MSGDASTTSVETALRRELEATRWRLYELEATEGDVVVERLISRLSDGLRGPLSVVTGVADMVDQVDLDATTLRHASTSLAASSRHLRGVIDDLGDYADLLSRNLVLREVPAESPSTMNNSLSSRLLELQSLSLPGRVSLFVALLRDTAALAARLAARARAAAKMRAQID